MAAQLLSADSPASLPTFQEVLLVHPNIDTLLILSEADLRDISDLVSHARETRHAGDIGEDVTCPLEVRHCRQYQLFDVQLGADHFIQEASRRSGGDGVEVRLRRIVSKMPLIPIVAASKHRNATIIAILRDQLPLTRETWRLQLELEINEFKRALDDGGEIKSVLHFVELLERSFAQREGRRYENLKKITFLLTSAYQLEFPVNNYLGERLWPATWPIQAEIFEHFVRSETSLRSILMNDDVKFVKRFMRVLELWIRWQDGKGFNYAMEFLLFHDYLMKYFPLESFLHGSTAFGLNWAGLIKVDRYMAARMSQAVSSADEYRRGGQAKKRDMWKKVFVDTPSLIDPLRHRMSDCLTAPTPGISLQQFTEITRLCQMAMTSAGLAEQGADEYIPTLVVLRDLAKPEYFLTRVAFFDKTFREIFAKMANPAVQGKLGMTYMCDCGKGFNHGISDLKFLAAELMKTYTDAHPDEVPPYDFQH
jgi:hypothetical protein